jgi:hypothetical protein
MIKMNTNPQREETKSSTKSNHRKLVLNRESLRILSAQRLEQVAGGATTSGGHSISICSLLVCTMTTL